MTGIIFDIKEFAVHDGPGGRLTVFLKGCPLRCIWCHNPEGLAIKPQIMVKENLCTRCGRCFQQCRHEDCKEFGRCIHVCPNGLITVSGEEYTPQRLAEKINGYKEFFTAASGGVTFSGGEPLMQADFVLNTVNRLDKIHVALETSGYAEPETFKRVTDKADYIMMDIKIADRDEHKKYTGVYNDVILKNFEYLKSSGKQFEVRTPMIPNICDTIDNLEKIRGIIGDSKWEKIPYNEAAPAKYKMLGKVYPFEELKYN